MKSRLFRASISSLLTGEYGIISFKRKPAFFNFDSHTSYRNISYPRKLVNCLISSSSDEEDDFSELGSPVCQGASTVLKLMTEKPGPLRLKQKTVPARKASCSMSLPAESSRTSEGISLKQGQPLSALFCPNLKNGNEVPKLNVYSKNASDCKNSSSITIKNIPSVINLSQLKHAISIFGKISNATMRTVPKELDCCDIEFESIESSSRAVSVGGITVGGFHLPIRPLHVPKTVTIRIRNIGIETAVSEIHSVCMSCSSLEGLVRIEEEVVDALFIVKDNSETQRILNKLNCTFIRGCQWSAHVQPKAFTEKKEDQTTGENSQCKLRLQISNRFAELKSQISMKRLDLEDLENLHLALVQVEGHHPATIIAKEEHGSPAGEIPWELGLKLMKL